MRDEMVLEEAGLVSGQTIMCLCGCGVGPLGRVSPDTPSIHSSSSRLISTTSVCMVPSVPSLSKQCHSCRRLQVLAAAAHRTRVPHMFGAVNIMARICALCALRIGAHGSPPGMSGVLHLQLHSASFPMELKRKASLEY
ncbi:unnamed protein product [Pleuronectes platessa]|uniref:Uncharacterized protein n=1 Tax=Pleuronectes platessa TaxID=8262 RepID=A0A9N7YYR1_PLEPL|nr:unnamed protein product [Pleuronectes platessa]